MIKVKNATTDRRLPLGDKIAGPGETVMVESLNDVPADYRLQGFVIVGDEADIEEAQKIKDKTKQQKKITRITETRELEGLGGTAFFQAALRRGLGEQ